jgi:hypothetical protein
MIMLAGFAIDERLGNGKRQCFGYTVKNLSSALRCLRGCRSTKRSLHLAEPSSGARQSNPGSAAHPRAGQAPAPSRGSAAGRAATRGSAAKTTGSRRAPTSDPGSTASPEIPRRAEAQQIAVRNAGPNQRHVAALRAAAADELEHDSDHACSAGGARRFCRCSGERPAGCLNWSVLTRALGRYGARNSARFIMRAVEPRWRSPRPMGVTGRRAIRACWKLASSKG